MSSQELDRGLNSSSCYALKHRKFRDSLEALFDQGLWKVGVGTVYTGALKIRRLADSRASMSRL